MQVHFSTEPPVYAKPLQTVTTTPSQPLSVGDPRHSRPPSLPSPHIVQPPTRPISPDRPALPPRPSAAAIHSSLETHSQVITSPPRVCHWILLIYDMLKCTSLNKSLATLGLLQLPYHHNIEAPIQVLQRLRNMQHPLTLMLPSLQVRNTVLGLAVLST